MKKYPPQLIEQVLRPSGKGGAAPDKGRALEEFSARLFGEIKGFELVKMNAVNASRSSELDLVFWTNRQISGLDFLDALLFIECKNTKGPSDCAVVSRFADKLRKSGMSVGILVSLSGITGNGEVNAKREIMEQLLMHGIKILVVNGAELSGLEDAGGLAALLREKFKQLVVFGRVAC